jgi:hypothetical protein
MIMKMVQGTVLGRRADVVEEHLRQTQQFLGIGFPLGVARDSPGMHLCDFFYLI